MDFKARCSICQTGFPPMLTPRKPVGNANCLFPFSGLENVTGLLCTRTFDQDKNYLGQETCSPGSMSYFVLIYFIECLSSILIFHYEKFALKALEPKKEENGGAVIKCILEVKFPFLLQNWWQRNLLLTSL